MKPEHLKYLREVAELVLDKFEEALANWDEYNPLYARQEALHEIDEYLRNLSIGAAPPPNRCKSVTAKIRKTHDGTDYREVVIGIGDHEFTTAAVEKEEAVQILVAVRETLSGRRYE